MKVAAQEGGSFLNASKPKGIKRGHPRTRNTLPVVGHF
jgi:hypothetical protein